MARSPRAAPVSVHVGCCGAHNPFLGDAGNAERTEARQGAIRIFSETPFPPQRPATHHSGFTRMRNPANRPLARDPARTPRPSRGAKLRKIAHRGFVGPAPVRLRRAVDAGPGTRMAGYVSPPKTRMAPCRASIPLPLPTRPHRRGATPACRRALTPFHCIAGHLAQSGTNSCNPIREEPKRMGLTQSEQSFSCSFLCSRGGSLNRRERTAWRAGRRGKIPGAVGNGRGMEARQGAMRIFWRDTVDAIAAGAHGSRTFGSPDGRS
jgi:hypothetical protein